MHEYSFFYLALLYGHLIWPTDTGTMSLITPIWINKHSFYCQNNTDTPNRIIMGGS